MIESEVTILLSFNRSDVVPREGEFVTFPDPGGGDDFQLSPATGSFLNPGREAICSLYGATYKDLDPEDIIGAVQKHNWIFPKDVQLILTIDRSLRSYTFAGDCLVLRANLPMIS